MCVPGRNVSHRILATVAMVYIFNLSFRITSYRYSVSNQLFITSSRYTTSVLSIQCKIISLLCHHVSVLNIQYESDFSLIHQLVCSDQQNPRHVVRLGRQSCLFTYYLLCLLLENIQRMWAESVNVDGAGAI